MLKRTRLMGVGIREDLLIDIQFVGARLQLSREQVFHESGCDQPGH